MFCGSDRVTDHLRAALLDQLPFAALGTIADVVPLLDENRIFARFGLRRLRDTSNLGLNALITAAGLDDVDRIEGDDVGFRLAPRLNAAGRMGHASDAVRLFATRDPREAMQLAGELERLNQQRQATERKIFEQAVAMLEEGKLITDDRRIIILAHEDWHTGVVGIVCSRLVSKYHRPVILMQRDGELLKGSARSIDGFSIHAALEHAQAHLSSWGGHEMAAGLAMKPEELDGFVETMVAYTQRELSVDDLEGVTHYDCDVTLDDFSPNAIRLLNDLGPFGRDHPAPSLRLCNVRLAKAPQPMGGGGKHLALFVTDGRKTLRLVAWSKGWMAEQLANGAMIDCICRPKLNVFNGVLRVEGELRDLAVR
jgi:single-stranded-DNA-specific exonuclease